MWEDRSREASVYRKLDAVVSGGQDATEKEESQKKLNLVIKSVNRESGVEAEIIKENKVGSKEVENNKEELGNQNNEIEIPPSSTESSGNVLPPSQNTASEAVFREEEEEKV